MSYDEELCRKVMKMHVPPTVQVLANDLHLNVGVKKEATIGCIRDGWSLVSDGILLINETVLGRWSKARSFKNSVDQMSVLVRLLRETELHGKRKVHVLAMGTRAEIVLNNVSSWFKSDVISLSKHKAPHPASLSYRFSDLNHKDCHMGTPSFSKLLAEILRNRVASVHIMAPKQSETELRLRLMVDSIQSVGGQLPPFEDDLRTFIHLQKRVEMSTNVRSDEYREMLSRMIECGETLCARIGIVASAFRTIDTSGRTVAGHVAKAGSSLSAVSPAQSAIDSHVGKEASVADRVPSSPITFTRTPRKNVARSVSSSQFTAASPTPATTSVNDSEQSPPPLTFTPKKKVALPPANLDAIVTHKPTPSSSNVGTLTFTRRVSKPAVPGSAVDAGDKKTAVPAVEKKPATESTTSGKVRKIGKKILDNLSSVEAVLQASGVDVIDDEDVVFLLGAIQNDIASETADNDITRDLVACIEEDIRTIPKFEFVDWAMDKQSKRSATYEKCKEYFKF
ncbi:hypothetical protein HIM_11635 [Hirsutella minnesotensis 3608]|uniref:Uncharacterized protein n=1 Tax=Hirsutella minnesotensis 3608 TaxID=1043627 RepID=A0A0F7ZR46_9HYPO|nr:hypothetical protein HIM_11635 [Hirsutella minnesotensis 3608]